MSYNFNDAIKAERGNYFNYGVHTVHIGAIETGTTANDKEYVEVTVLGDNDETDTARVWFTTEKSANYGFDVLRQIAVHNAKPALKDKARDEVNKTKNPEELVHLLNEMVIGGECWFTVYPDPTRTYTNTTGDTKPSINKDILGYEPKLREELMPKQDVIHEVKDDADVSGGIPSDWK